MKLQSLDIGQIASTATVEVKNNNYSKLGVASNYIGIIGSQGHTSIYGENNEYKNQNYKYGS